MLSFCRNYYYVGQANCNSLSKASKLQQLHMQQANCTGIEKTAQATKLAVCKLTLQASILHRLPQAPKQAWIVHGSVQVLSCRTHLQHLPGLAEVGAVFMTSTQTRACAGCQHTQHEQD
jgi:hypothetical protein